MGDGWMDRYALQALLLSKVSKWFQSGFNHLFGGPVNPLILDITFFYKGRGKERLRKRKGRGTEKERKRKGRGKGKERKRTNPRKGKKERKRNPANSGFSVKACAAN